MFPAYEMTLAEGINIERRLFYQTFATVSFVLLAVNYNIKL